MKSILLLRSWTPARRIGLRFVLVLAALACCLNGCTREPKGGPRVKTVPITGKVLVDGKPTKGIVVTFKRISPPGVDFPVPEPYGETDESGALARVSTYISNDGGAPGEYMLLFALANRLHPITGELVGDAFRGKYMNMNSEFKITIPKTEDGKPYDLGTIELTMK